MFRDKGRHRGDVKHASKLRLAGIGLAFLAVLGVAAVSGKMVYSLAFTHSPAVGTALPRASVTPQPSDLWQVKQHQEQHQAAPVRTYVVASGDCLWKIAHKELGSGTQWKTLASLNHLSYPWVIQTGQILTL